MKKAFTMIELIFVIVIIGILASVAIPKLAVSRNNAQSAICSNEIGQFLSNISMVYVTHGYDGFKDLKASDITNSLTLSSAPNAGVNAFLDTKVDIVGVDYYCDGEKMINFVGNVVNSDYNIILTLEDENSVATPVATQSIQKIREYLLNGLSVRTYTL